MSELFEVPEVREGPETDSLVGRIMAEQPSVSLWLRRLKDIKHVSSEPVMRRGDRVTSDHLVEVTVSLPLWVVEIIEENGGDLIELLGCEKPNHYVPSWVLSIRSKFTKVVL